jgi:hypothetical protein
MDVKERSLAWHQRGYFMEFTILSEKRAIEVTYTFSRRGLSEKIISGRDLIPLKKIDLRGSANDKQAITFVSSNQTKVDTLIYKSRGMKHRQIKHNLDLRALCKDRIGELRQFVLVQITRKR